jgi:hypothetical protein
MADWVRRKTIATTTSPWVSVHTEQWEDDQGHLLDYWRVERPDSVIVLPIHRDRFLLPAPVFRPGIGRATLDFPGGRLPPERQPQQQVAPILERELGIPAAAIDAIAPLNQAPWPVDSAFSSQQLWGFTAAIRADWTPAPTHIGRTSSTDTAGVRALLQDLHCLQCRALLQHWLLQQLQPAPTPLTHATEAERLL